MRRNAVRIAVLALAGLVMQASRATAQGFGVYEHDACAMGRAGTGVAAPCNTGSAMFYNPAGLVRAAGTNNTNKWEVELGGTMIRPSFTFADSATGANFGGPTNSILVPHLYVSRQFANGWAGGLGVFAPYGLVSEWDLNTPQRFLGYRSELKTIYFQPTVAKQINSWLSIGAGFDFIHTSVKLQQRLDLSSQATTTAGVTFANLGVPVGTDFADAMLKGGSNSAGAHMGVLIKPVRRVSIGARYLFRSTADIQGDATFTPFSTGITLAAGNPLGAPGGTPLDSIVAPQFRTGGALVKQHASTRVPLPDQIVVGAAVNVTDQLTLLADYQWVHWDRFSKLNLSFANLGTRTLWEDYGNTNGYRFGAQFAVTPKVSIRGGMLKHDGAAPDNTVTPLLPEGARVEQTLGASFQISTNGRLEAAYQHINQQDRRGRVVDAPRFGGAALNSGLYTGNANLFGVSLVWGF
jgi:long-chain fatty acid transport protein